MRVLLIDAGNTSAYHAMRSLARSGHEVHLVGGPRTAAHRSKYCGRAIQWERSQLEDDAGLIASLIEQVKATRYDLLLSCSETAAELIFTHHDALSNYVECGIPDPSVREVAFNKNAAYRLAEAIGVPSPAIFYPESVEEAVRRSEAMRYPLVVKGQKGSAAAHVRFVATPEAFEANYREICALEPDVEGLPSVQEYIGGDGYVVHLLYFEGQARAVCAHRKDREFPFGGGVTCAATTVAIPELQEAALKVVGPLNWHGLIKVDFKFDPKTGEYKFIELTPRVSASIDITRAAGADQVALFSDLLQGRRAPSLAVARPGVRYRWLFPRDLMHLVMQPKLLWQAAPDLLSRNVYFDMSLEDWRPLVSEAYRFLRERDFTDPRQWRRLRQAREIERLNRAHQEAAPRFGSSAG